MPGGGVYTWVSNVLVEISALCTLDLRREKRHLYKTILERQICEQFEDLLISGSVFWFFCFCFYLIALSN